MPSIGPPLSPVTRDGVQGTQFNLTVETESIVKRIAMFAVVAFSLALSFGAYAAEKKPDNALQATTKEKFDDQAGAIREQMKIGGRWEFVSADERSKVESRLDEISGLMAKVNHVDELSEKDRLQMYVAQEDVNAILTKKDGRRLICESIAPTGSNRKIKQCVTYAERERTRKATSDHMFRNRYDAQVKTKQ